MQKLLILLTSLLSMIARAGSEAPMAALREIAMSDVFVLKDYRPGKNSYVESTQRHIGAWTHAGFRRTILDLKGQGSLRHIWTTRSDNQPSLDWEFYVDGETQPSIRATDREMSRAAALFSNSLAGVIAPTVPLGMRDYNLFLPVPFDHSLRVDVVQRLPTVKLWFCQLDYRLQDKSLSGARLIGQRDGTNFAFVARDWPAALEIEHGDSFSVGMPAVDLEPKKTATFSSERGPGIVRELFIESSKPDATRLLISYDDAPDAAVNSPVDRFFGPFNGVSFERQGPTAATCYLPMPFKRNVRVSLRNGSTSTIRVASRMKIEQAASFSSDWGYFHALHHRSETTDGHRPLQVLYLHGRGHWLGMTLYKTGHDHGGGDFAIVDGEGDDPAFLHGVNGEDYFTFAWFGRGAHHPYAMALSNDEGRYRHHFENPYPFKRSFALEWGAYPGLNPESVAVWYQDGPHDTTVADGARINSVCWDVFGPVPIPYDAHGTMTTNWTSVLPPIAALDSGGTFECKLIDEKFKSGWMREWSVGPALNLTYIGRHGTNIKGEIELGGMGHACIARRFITSSSDVTARYLIAHDDPIEVEVNAAVIYRADGFNNGFESRKIQLPLKSGRNEIVIRLANTFNRDFNWAGFLLRPSP